MPADNELSRARTTAILLAAAVVISLISLVYAKFQHSEVEKLRMEVDSLKNQLELKVSGN